MLTSETLETILSELGFRNLEDAALKQAELVLLSKISKYEAENNFFKNKYNVDYETMMRRMKENENREIFEEEDDLLDWQFAFESLTKYKKQYSQLV